MGTFRRVARARRGGFALLAVVAVSGIGCSQRATPGTVARATAKIVPIRGTVKAIRGDAGQITLAHDAIPGLMGAMTMSIPLRAPDLAEGLAAGDSVSGRLAVERGRMTLIELHKTSTSASMSETHQPPGPSAQSPSASVRAFELTGDVLAVRPDRTGVTIHHDPIPGYMPLSMTMDFPVEPVAVLAGIQPGDRVKGRLRVGEREGWVDRLERIGKAKEPVDPEGPLPEGEPIPLGRVVPDFSLTDQDQRSLRLRDFRGKALVLTFIYTRCPFPQFCPLVSKQFEDLQGQLRRRPGLAERVHLLSISFDPTWDTPERLKTYARGRHADPGLWSFAVGPAATVGRVAGFFGLIYYPERGEITHTMRTAVIGPDGRLVALFKNNDWTPRQVAKQLAELLHVKKEKGK